MQVRFEEDRAVPLPRNVLERAQRVWEYHQTTKHTYDSVRQIRPHSELSTQPSSVRVFPGLPKLALPTGLLDIPVSAMGVMRDGLAALPESHIQPPQDMKTLATWLFMAYGVSAQKQWGIYKYRLRTCPSAGALFPCEIYVAAFGIKDLEPGLYSYNPHEFALTRLRSGSETLSQLKRGRPDLAFLKTVPAALLVSTIYSRTAWKYHARGFRMALLDAGHLIANLVATANGLGIQTMTRLKMNDNTMRELIGIPPQPEFGNFEAVQSMVVWADDASSSLGSRGPADAQHNPPPVNLPEIPRPPLTIEAVPDGSITAVHYDCVKPGIPLRQIHPPLTELSPLPAEHPMQELPVIADPGSSASLRQILLKRRSPRDFVPGGISRDRFLTINQAAFRAGTFLPLHPDGPHLGLVRPFWVVNDVTGVHAGVWYYHPPADRWVLLRRGNFRRNIGFICLEQVRCANASAVCLITSNIQVLMTGAGPDVYRLGHLEAGIAAQRMALAAAACDLGACAVGSFYDDEIRLFLGLQQTGWEPLYAVAVGVPSTETEPPGHPGLGIG